MKDAKHVYAISERLKKLEEEGDAIYHEAVGALFAEGADPLEVIKWKEMYDTLEGAIDSLHGRRARCCRASPSRTPEPWSLRRRDRPDRVHLRFHQRLPRFGEFHRHDRRTRVLSPFAAVIWAAVFNFAAAFTGSLAVAKAIGGGMIEQSIVKPNVILAGLLGAIIWNLITWFFGIPSSSSHALIGGYAGAGVATRRLAAITWGTKWIQTLSFIVISPLVGMLAGFLLMVIVFWLFQAHGAGARRSILPAGAARAAPRCSRIRTAANDAQKTMGIIVGLLVSAKRCSRTQTGWLSPLLPARRQDDSALGRDRRLHRDLARHAVRRLAHRAHDGLAHHASCVRSVGSAPRLAGRSRSSSRRTSAFRSARRTRSPARSSASGATHRLSAVRWGIAGRIVWAWILTIPAAATMAAISYFPALAVQSAVTLAHPSR